MTEDVEETPPGLSFDMPWAASAASLEQMDKRMVMYVQYTMVSYFSYVCVQLEIVNI